MTNFEVIVGNVEGVGYWYALRRNAIDVKVVTSIPTLGQAWNSVRDDLAANLGTETFHRAVINVLAI